METRDEIRKLAYDMEQAYATMKTQGEAVEWVKDRNSTADLNILWAMWWAIDVYVDMHR